MVVVALAGLAFFLYRRRRQRRINTTKKELAIDALTVPPVRQSKMYGVQPNYPSSNLYPPQPSISDTSNFATRIAAVNNTFNSYPDVLQIRTGRRRRMFRLHTIMVRSELRMGQRYVIRKGGGHISLDDA